MTNRITNHVYSNVSTSQGPFTVRGGLYGMSVHATFGGGSVTLQRLAADGSTWVTVLTAFAADGYAPQYLISGTYQITIATATGVYVELVSIAQPV